MPALKELPNVEIKKVKGFNLRGIYKRKDKFTIHFTGYIKIDKEGVYTFTMGSDDGSKLSIGPELLIDNDGSHGYNELSGKIYLLPGIYPLSWGYFEGQGGQELNVFIEGPGLKKQNIPAEMLYRRKEK